MTDEEFVDRLTADVKRVGARARRVVLGGTALEQFDRAAPERDEYALDAKRGCVPVRTLCGVPVYYGFAIGPNAVGIDRVYVGPGLARAVRRDVRKRAVVG